MLNWRKPLLLAGMRLTRNEVPRNISRIHNIEYSPEDAEQLRRQRLRTLLDHAHATVPYYNDLLDEHGVVVDGSVNLDSFERLPLLTKSDIRDAGDRLQSSNPGPNPYENTSGGTTGEPVTIVQDEFYWRWNVANKLYYQSLAGKELGEPEVKLWGSERDIQEGRRSPRTRLRNFLYNRRALNSFKMSRTDMREYVSVINDFEPKTIWAYVESIHQLARFIDDEGLLVHSPAGIISTAGTLHEPVRETVERVFGTTVHNQYGSREVGDIACECAEQEGLHVFSYTNYVEIVDEDGDPVDPGEEGYVVVTNLTNRTMPMIRYKIGDMAIPKGRPCSCGRSFPLLETVTGRTSDHFVSPSGDLVHGEYFTHLFYHRDWVDKFQVRQTSRDKIKVIIITDRCPAEIELREIRQGITDVMGTDVKIIINFQDEIAPASSGKYRYTISDVVK